MQAAVVLSLFQSCFGTSGLLYLSRGTVWLNQTDYIFFAVKDGEPLHSQQKQDREQTMTQTMNSLLPNSDLN